jgi:DNA polymerase-3 subunit chi
LTDIAFYHLQRSPLAAVLPKLLEKAMAVPFRILVLAPGEAEVEKLNTLLWTYDADSFLPHGSAKDGWSDRQPIYITAAEENPNASTMLVQVGGAEHSGLAGFVRVLDIFDGNDETALAAARERWKRYRDAGHALTYWQQKDGGGWERKA